MSWWRYSWNHQKSSRRGRRAARDSFPACGTRSSRRLARESPLWADAPSCRPTSYDALSQSSRRSSLRSLHSGPRRSTRGISSTTAALGSPHLMRTRRSCSATTSTRRASSTSRRPASAGGGRPRRAHLPLRPGAWGRTGRTRGRLGRDRSRARRGATALDKARHAMRLNADPSTLDEAA